MAIQDAVGISPLPVVTIGDVGTSCRAHSDYNVQLDAKGNFSIPVVLKPGADTDRMGGERFSYQIEVSVTGDAGETQTSQYNLSAARRAYFFMSDISRELCKGRFHVRKAGK